MSDFIFSITFIVMLSFFMQVGACLELMGEVCPLVGQAFFVLTSIVMLSFFIHFHSYVKFFVYPFFRR
jgi:hypothetical protein